MQHNPAIELAGTVEPMILDSWEEQELYPCGSISIVLGMLTCHGASVKLLGPEVIRTRILHKFHQIKLYSTDSC